MKHTQKKREEDTHLPLFVVTLGSATIDTILYNTAQDICLLPGKQNISNVLQFPGGGAINTSLAFAASGDKAYPIASVGNDSLHKQIIEKLQTHNINCSYLICKDIPTRQSFIFPSQQQDTAILCHTPTKHNLQLTEVDFDIISQADHLHISSLNLKNPRDLLSIINYAYNQNVTITYNPNSFFLKNHADIVLKVLPLLTIFICNRHELALLFPSLTFDAALHKLQSMTSACIVITADKDGSYALHKNITYHQPVIPSNIINTTGAGDTFGAIFSSHFIKKGCVKTALLQAAHAAQKIVSQHQPTLL